MASNKKAPRRGLGERAAGQGARNIAAPTVVRAPAFVSKTLGHEVTLKSVADLHPDDLRDVAAEIGAAISEVNASIRIASSEAHRTGIHLCRIQWAELQASRGALGALHQKVLARVAQQNRQEKQRRHEAQLQAQESLAQYFQQVVRNEANPVDYQRWVLQAETRRAADLARARQTGVSHG